MRALSHLKRVSPCPLLHQMAVRQLSTIYCVVDLEYKPVSAMEGWWNDRFGFLSCDFAEKESDVVLHKSLQHHRKDLCKSLRLYVGDLREMSLLSHSAPKRDLYSVGVSSRVGTPLAMDDSLRSRGFGHIKPKSINPARD